MQNINEIICQYNIYKCKAERFLVKLQGYCEEINEAHNMYELRMTIFEGLNVDTFMKEGKDFYCTYTKLDGEAVRFRVPFDMFYQYLQPNFDETLIKGFAQQMIDERQEYFDERDRKKEELREMAAKMGYVLQPK